MFWRERNKTLYAINHQSIAVRAIPQLMGVYSRVGAYFAKNYFSLGA